MTRLYEVTAYLKKEDFDRIRARVRETGLSRSRVARDYMLAGFVAEDAASAGAKTLMTVSDRYDRSPRRMSIPPRAVHTANRKGTP